MPTALGRLLAVLGGWGAAVSSVDPAGVSLPLLPCTPQCLMESVSLLAGQENHKISLDHMSL